MVGKGVLVCCMTSLRKRSIPALRWRCYDTGWSEGRGRSFRHSRGKPLDSSELLLPQYVHSYLPRRIDADRKSSWSPQRKRVRTGRYKRDRNVDRTVVLITKDYRWAVCVCHFNQETRLVGIRLFKRGESTFCRFREQGKADTKQNQALAHLKFSFFFFF